MALQQILEGSFIASGDQADWTVQIYREQDAVPATVGTLEFPGEEPLVIEWLETAKEDVICSSIATLRLLSPGDRTYADLYTIEAGSVQMRVLRNRDLYWEGTLDTETYEEPYAYESDYEVELTFGDFGILDRLKWANTDIVPLRDILSGALEGARLTDLEVIAKRISTEMPSGRDEPLLRYLLVRGDNFFDEDGEALTLKEVIEGVMQPLGLKMVQRAGRVFVYDLNALWGEWDRGYYDEIIWHDEDQVMGVDKVVNNVKVNFSPYAQPKLLDGKLEYKGKHSADYLHYHTYDSNIVLQPSPSADGERWYTYPPGEAYGPYDFDNQHFTIFIKETEEHHGTIIPGCKGLPYLHPAAQACHIEPLLNGPSEQDAIAWYFWLYGHGDLFPRPEPNPTNNGVRPVASPEPLMRTYRVFLPTLSETERKGFYLRLTLEMLLDGRMNPFTDPENNFEDNYNTLRGNCRWAFVPVAITVYATGEEGAEALCHYVNRNKSAACTQGNLQATVCQQSGVNDINGYDVPEAVSWERGEGRAGECWLEYYDGDDPLGGTAITGWKKNRQNIGRPDNDYRYSHGIGFGHHRTEFTVLDSLKKIDDGEYIPYPPTGGFLEVTVYEGVNCYCGGEAPDALWNDDFSYWMPDPDHWQRNNLYKRVRWLLYKAPVLEVVKNNLAFDSAGLDDVEYNGYINPAAKEELSIDTICGTTDKVCPTARGCYYDATCDMAPVTTFTRGDHTDRPERLLIGTLYSQYAERHMRLSGTANLLAGHLAVYRDRATKHIPLMMTADVQDLDAATSEAVFVELSPDEYEEIEEVN